MSRKDTEAVNWKTFYYRLYVLAAPIVFQSLMLASVAAGDALMLGRVAQNEMTAVSLATQIQFVLIMFIAAIVGAGSILGAQYYGKGDRRAIQELFNLMLRFSLVLSVLFCAACELAPDLLMSIFTHDPELIRIGSSYLRIAGWSYILSGISQCYLTVMKVTDHVMPSAWISSAAVISNIILNAVFIFGYLGAPAMQSRGAALATSLARGIELALCLIMVCVSCFFMIMNVAMKLRDNYYRLTAVGLGTLYALQVFLTIGGVIKFIPSTGVTLPLVSYGGSSLLSTMIVFGIIQGLYIMQFDGRTQKKEQKRRRGRKE